MFRRTERSLTTDDIRSTQFYHDHNYNNNVNRKKIDIAIIREVFQIFDQFVY